MAAALIFSPLGLLPALRASPRARAPTATATTAATFEEWAVTSGIAAPKLRIDDLDELRGAVAREPVASGEALCVVPRSRCLDLAGLDGGETPCPDLAPQRLWDRLAWYERLAVWLLAEKSLGEASMVSGYISYLPQPGCASFYDAPLHWEDAELTELQYPPLVQAVYEQREQIRSLHERVRGGGGARAGSVGLDAVAWAEQVVWSRAFASTVKKTGARGGADAGSSPPPPPPPSPPPPPPPPPRDVKTNVLFEAEWLGKLKELLPGDVGETLRLGRDPALASGPMEMALMPMLDALNHASTAAPSEQSSSPAPHLALPAGQGRASLRFARWRAPPCCPRAAPARGGVAASSAHGPHARSCTLSPPRRHRVRLVLLRRRRRRLRALVGRAARAGRAGLPLVRRQGQRRAPAGENAPPLAARHSALLGGVLPPQGGVPPLLLLLLQLFGFVEESNPHDAFLCIGLEEQARRGVRVASRRTLSPSHSPQPESRHPRAPMPTPQPMPMPTHPRTPRHRHATRLSRRRRIHIPPPTSHAAA